MRDYKGNTLGFSPKSRRLFLYLSLLISIFVIGSQLILWYLRYHMSPVAAEVWAILVAVVFGIFVVALTILAFRDRNWKDPYLEQTFPQVPSQHLNSDNYATISPKDITPPAQPWKEVLLTLGYNDAYDLCTRAVALLPFGRVEVASRDTGTIHASSTGSMGADSDFSAITIFLVRTGPVQTKVQISCNRTISGGGRRFEPPVHETKPDMVAVDTIASFLRDTTPQTGTDSSGILTQESHPETNTHIISGHSGKKYFTKSPTLAALLSIFPGLGAVYTGKQQEGVIIAFGAWFGLLLWYIPGILIWLFGIHYAWSTARNIRNGTLPYSTVTQVSMIVWAAGTILVFITFLFVAYTAISVFRYPGMPGIVIPMRPTYFSLS